MQVASMARKVNKQFKKKLSSEDIAAAIEQTFLKSSDQLPGEFGFDDVVEGLVRFGKLPQGALKSTSSKGKKATGSKETGPKRRRSGSSLVFEPHRQRAKSAQDEAELEWMEQVIAEDADIRRLERDGQPFRPPWELSLSGNGAIYLDPLSNFLEPHEFSKYVPTGADCNEIYASYEKFKLWEDNPAQSFQWRSNELIHKFEAKLLGLWCAKTHCRLCYLPLEGGLWEEVKSLLRGDKRLPGTPGVSTRKAFVYPETHTWCVGIRKAKLRVSHEIHVKGWESDDEEAVAHRTSQYVNAIREIASEYEVVSSTVVEAWKAIDRNDRERNERAGS